VAEGAPLGMTRGGESRLKARPGPHRVMCVSLFVCIKEGLVGLVGVSDILDASPADRMWAGSSLSDSGEPSNGDSGKSDVRSSPMERCLRIGFLAIAGGIGRSSATAVFGEGLGV
jgi:hypothetical protein